MTPEEILAWLSNIPSDLDCDRTETVTVSGSKRKRQGSAPLIPSPPLSTMDPEAEAGQQHKRMRTSGTDDQPEIGAANNVQQPPHAEEQLLAIPPHPASPFKIPIPPSSAPAASGSETASTGQASNTGDSSTGGGQGVEEQGVRLTRGFGALPLRRMVS